jgi:hypothetical protein
MVRKIGAGLRLWFWGTIALHAMRLARWSLVRSRPEEFGPGAVRVQPYQDVLDRNSYRCGWCHRVTYNPEDVMASYCSCCGSADGLLPKDCEHTRGRR